MRINKIYSITMFLTALTFLFVIGCEKKTETNPEEKVETTIEKPTVETPVEKVDSVKPEAPKIVIPDMLGTWSGTFDSRACTLKITKQDSTAFSGSITINYREVVNQSVSGTINVEKNTVSMRDLIHSRYQGTYSGKLSADLKNLSGTFTITVDKKNLSFNLNKK